MVYFSVVAVLLVLLRFTNGSQSHWMVYMCGYDESHTVSVQSQVISGLCLSH